MKTHPITENHIAGAQLIKASPTGQDPAAENPHGNGDTKEKLPTAPACEPHFFYYPSL